MAKYELQCAGDLPLGLFDTELVAQLGPAVQATLSRAESGLSLELEAPDSSAEDLQLLDVQAQRIAAVMTLVLKQRLEAERVQPPPTTWRITGSFSATRVLRSDQWVRTTRKVASALLPAADPRILPGWDVFLIAIGVSDSIARFSLLWAVLDLLVAAQSVGQIDDVLATAPHGPVRDCPDRNGNVNRETFPTYCRQRLAHAFGRSDQGTAIDLPRDCARAVTMLEQAVLAEIAQRAAAPGL